MDHIDFQAFKDSQNSDKSQQGRYLKDIQRWIENGEWPFSYNRLISVQMPREDTFMVNTSRMTGFDGTDAASVSKAMAQGRRESLMLLEILRRKIPGFQNARIKAIAPLLGVRETRRILGDFLLTLKHFQEETAFDDIIGYAAYGWDLPDPHRPSVNPNVGKAAGIKRSIMPIPYRVMLPKKFRNLICPGRAVSVERPILGPFRVQAPCMAMGEAAGVAAALMIREQSAFDTIDAAQLRTTLKQQNAIVDANAFADNPVKM